MKTCETCRFMGGRDEAVQYCRRGPPTVTTPGNSSFAVVNHEMTWCGEHRRISFLKRLWRRLGPVSS